MSLKSTHIPASRATAIAKKAIENLYISNIPDLKLCETEEDVLEVISHN